MGDTGVSLVSEQGSALRALLSEGAVENEHDIVNSEQLMLKTGIPHVDVERGERVVIGVAQSVHVFLHGLQRILR